MSRATVATLLAVLTVATPGALRAQDAPVEADPDEARRQYECGEAAVAEERWDDASACFARAYELSAAPSAGFNAAMSLRAQGRHRSARDFLRRLLGAHPDWEHAERLREALAEAERRIARVRITGEPPWPDVVVRLDGRDLEDVVDPMLIEVDPGEHSVRVIAEGFEPFAWTETLEAATTRELRVALRALPSPSASPEAPAGDDLTWVAIVVPVLVVLGVAAVVTGVLLDEAAQLAPSSPNVVRFP